MRLKVLERFLDFQFSGLHAQGLGVDSWMKFRIKIISSSIINNIIRISSRVFKYPGLLFRRVGIVDKIQE